MREPDLSVVAGLFADRSRAAMLEALMDGADHAAGALARAAGIGAPTASAHLSRLVDGGLITVESVGRERRFRLAGPVVAEAVEALMALAPEARPTGLRAVSERSALRHARTCYDHLAGRLGVEVTAGLRRDGHLAGTELRLTRRGREPFERLGIDLTELRRGRRPLTCSCLDGTERRPHLAGALGAALATSLIERGWIERRRTGRALRITRLGERELSARGWLPAQTAIE
jgi:DNA-binding transcriptional ArsR family regulator